MKKAWIAAAWFLGAAGMLTGFTATERPKLTEIDTSIPVQPGMRIAVVSKTTKGQFWKLVRSGMETAVEAVNESYDLEKNDRIKMTFEGPGDELWVESQINTIDAVLAENPDVLCLAVADMDSCQAQLEMARENGIPVVVFDSNVGDKELVTAFRATDHREIGRQAAAELASALEEKGEILVFSAQEKSESIRNRMQGFQEVIEQFPQIEIDEVYYEDQVPDMNQAMLEALEQYPEADGVFCTNAEVSDLYLGLSAELRDGILMVGVDATSKQQEALKNGEELCVISQDPGTLGYETILTAVYAAMQEDADVSVAETILLPPQKIDMNNLFSPLYSNYVYSE